MTVLTWAQRAKLASRTLATLPDEVRRQAIMRFADALHGHGERILSANRQDMQTAKAEGLAGPLLKRLALTDAKIAEMIAGLRSLCSLPDPLGQTTLSRELSPGLSLFRVTCPIGVVGVIFESRPDALVQIAALCLRSGNAVLLKGGREAMETCQVLFALMEGAARQAGIPDGWAALLTSREEVGEMLSLHSLIDLIIPRGSNDFVRYIMEHSRIPVLGHADGLCHVYIDKDADIPMAAAICVDSKAQYVSVCNAAETLLVHEAIAKAALPPVAEALKKAGVTLRGCPRTQDIIPCDAAADADWDREYLDYILSIKVVDSLEMAIAHINRHGSGHTDAIVTANEGAARTFCAQVDSAGAYWNCSTRFADGYRYGFGAEVGVSTGKLHARGPMGIEGLCTYKYKAIGSGHTVGGGVPFTHKPLSIPCPLEDTPC